MKIQGSSVFTQMKNLHVDASTGVWETAHPIPPGKQATPCTSWALGKLWFSKKPAQGGRQQVYRGHGGKWLGRFQVPICFRLKFNYKTTKAISWGLKRPGYDAEVWDIWRLQETSQEAPWVEPLLLPSPLVLSTYHTALGLRTTHHCATVLTQVFIQIVLSSSHP